MICKLQGFLLEDQVLFMLEMTDDKKEQVPEWNPATLAGKTIKWCICCGTLASTMSYLRQMWWEPSISAFWFHLLQQKEPWQNPE